MLNRKITLLICILASVVSHIYFLDGYKNSQHVEMGYASALEEKTPASIKDGKGTAVVIPSDDVVVNTYGTWKIVYTVGKEGIDRGGGIAVHISPFWGWTPPQNSNQDYPGYITVTTSNDKATLDVLVGQPHYVVVRTQEIPLTYKQSITITYGDTGEGKHPHGKAKCDKYAEDGEEFFIKVDGDGDGYFHPIAHQPRINILPGPAAALVATASSLVEIDKPFKITIAAVDPYDNWAKGYLGTINLSSSPSEIDIPRTYHFTKSDRGAKKFQCTVKKTGVYRIKVEDKKNGFTTESNPILCTDNPLNYHLYWGDIHGHSGLCDGTGTPDNYYQYARDVAGLDISALTTHDAHGFIPLDEDEETWDLIRRKTDSYYHPGEFVTFLGYEWTSWTYGHQHVLFLNSEEGEVFSFRDPKSSTPNKLWKCLKGKEAITIPHHVGGGPIAYDWNFYSADFQPLTEICSVHGNCEFLGCSKGIYNPKKGHFVCYALARGYRLGITASGDSHNGHPGRRDVGALTSGLMGVYAKALDRESIWTALKNRKVYATSGARIILDFHIDGHSMGEIVYFTPLERKPSHFRQGGKNNKFGNGSNHRPSFLTGFTNESDARDISSEVIGTDDIKEITIIKNGFDLHTIQGQGIKNTIHYIDKTMLEEGDYYYLRAIQEDGEMAWSSPIWFEQQHDAQ